jgi:hypothetical protein
MGPPINIQNICQYVQEINANFRIGLTYAICAHHGRSHDTCYLGKWTIYGGPRPLYPSYNTFSYAHWSMSYVQHYSNVYEFQWMSHQWV